VIATVGYYSTLAMVMNAARTPVPDGYERLP
jgi:4-carboxymuconolactone decarboxylase